MHYEDRERKVDLDWDVSDQWQVRIILTLFLCVLAHSVGFVFFVIIGMCHLQM